MDVDIRKAGPEDADVVAGLVRALADYEKLPAPGPDALARLAADFSGDRPRLEVWLAQRGGAPVGYAATFETYSTFRARPLLYLEDLFVLPEHRRAGVAKALLRRLARRAKERGCARVTWMVLDWNVDAQRFYERLGAKREASWWPFVLEGEALDRLADGG
ncbi:MAG TPA: GNAT family N-acetyltransferase [Candidatus Thermoplasmatota archaeon]|nr:GNAT family N-acetyltransferase [Candidatus Thermoplasmatota archaeon]